MIKLTKKEIEVIEEYLKKPSARPMGENADVLNEVVKKASELEKELDAYDESDNLIEWFYDQYKKQQEDAQRERELFLMTMHND